eukprot:TRINITY_DN1327_c11_g1_i1.p1 TRINITY_DN1327_c11_g1~~TRINITY_DN1327_c11_g1_i1.p1  ORF type:complete len:407 (+),score=69.51 TRINITY_DN1327_c11_g1_i1:115-1335(+)
MKLILFSSLIGMGLACSTTVDCSLNGECVNGACVCDSPWKGPKCEVLDRLPTDLSWGFRSPYNGGKTSSWGGSVLKINGTYHMYSSQMENFCGIQWWEPNSKVVHAVSQNPEGPYIFSDVVSLPFTHEPTAVRAPTGEVVIYFTMRHPDGYELTNCTEPTPTPAPVPPAPPGPPPTPTPCYPPPPRHTYMTYATNAFGPWSEPVLVLKANESKWGNCPVLIDANVAMTIRPDGSGIGIWRKCVNNNNTRCHADCCTFPHLLTTSNWRDPSTYIPSQTPMFPDMLPYGAEDPYIWLDAKRPEGVHAIFHDEQGATRSSANGTHAFSPDNGKTWYYGEEHCYNGEVQQLNGTTKVFARREHPHLILDDTGRPTHITNGVQEADQSVDCFTDAQCYRSYTLVQPLKQQE